MGTHTLVLATSAHRQGRASSNPLRTKERLVDKTFL